MKQNDTIAAISTPIGVGGIAVVRISGVEAYDVAITHLSVAVLEPRKATYCHFDDIDDIVATYFPTGYTGEPTVEIACHGSLYVQQAVLQALTESGARMALAGEFTLRAFANGKLDLSQAEAVADLIDSVTPAQHRLALSQLRGGYAHKLKELRQQLVDLTALLELELDFSQEDVEFADRSQLRELLTTLHTQLTTLIQSFSMGNAVKRGIPVAIVGAPNVGKSTLLNALLQDDRAIVSPVPGTTRDTIEGLLTLDGITFRLIDTAGLRETDDSVEQLGIARSRKAYEDALVVLHVYDTTEGMEEIHTNDGKRHIIVLNKCDMIEAGQREVKACHINVSAKNGDGLEALRLALKEAVGDRAADDTLLTNSRHFDALRKVDEALKRVDQALDEEMPADLVAVDLRDALYHLGTITGEVASEEVLGSIFGRFCVGK